MPTPPHLRKWQRNQIFEAIQSVGLDPKEFDLEDSDAAVRIKHKWSESYFVIGGNAGQIRVLDAKINYIVEAAGRLGRTDWRGLFVGVIVSYILTAALPPESAHAIFRTFVTLLQAIGHLYGYRLPELPGA